MHAATNNIVAGSISHISFTDVAQKKVIIMTFGLDRRFQWNSVEYLSSVVDISVQMVKPSIAYHHLTL